MSGPRLNIRVKTGLGCDIECVIGTAKARNEFP